MFNSTKISLIKSIDIGSAIFFLEILRSLFAFPPEAIVEIFLYSLVLFLIHFSYSDHTLVFTKSFNILTVPILNDFDLIIFPLFIIVSSVLPPPTSTYNKLL